MNLLTIIFFTTVAMCAAAEQRNFCLEETNRVRSQYGLPALQADHRLELAADDHARTMCEQNCNSAQCPGEPDLGRRVSRRGYRYRRVGENFAWNHRDCRAAVQSWMHGSGSRSNMLGNYKHIGCAEVNRRYVCTYAR